MRPDPIHDVWPEPNRKMVEHQLRLEAANRFRLNALPDTLAEWKLHREILREQIWSNLGTKPDHDLALDFQVHGEIPMDGYVVKNVTYQSRPGLRVTGNLYVPDGEGPFPAVLGTHGHWQQGRLAERVQARGHTTAKNGYVCLCVDALGSGERSDVHGEYAYHGGQLGASLFDVGESLMGMQVVDNMRAIDLLCSFDFVDSERIGVTGASGGGNQTMWVAAMDDRIKAAMPVVSVGSFESYVCGCNCVCEVLPNGLTFTEEYGVLALTAPRALKICNALGDTNPAFFPSEMIRSFEIARKIYQLYDADPRCAYQVFNLPHGYWPEVRETMLGWFDRWLKDEGDGSPRAEIPFDCLPEENVMCFAKGKRPKEVMGVADYCRKRHGELAKTRESRETQPAEERKRELREILKLTVPGSTPAWIEHGTVGINETSWIKVTLQRDGDRLIPALLRAPAEGSKRLIIGSHPNGKKTFFESGLLDQIDSETGVLVMDPWGSGETAVEFEPPELPDHVHFARSCLWLGKTVMGEWAADLLAATRSCRQRFPETSIGFAGFAETALAAVFAAAFDEDVESLLLKSMPVTYKFGDNAPTDINLGVHLPGFLKWGDVPDVLKLIDANVQILDPVGLDGKRREEPRLETSTHKK